MATLTVDSSGLTGEERENILKNLHTLFATRAGSVGMDRDFGLDWECVDRPPEIAKALMEAEIVTKAATYVPEARIEQITWSGDGENLAGKVKVINNE